MATQLSRIGTAWSTMSELGQFFALSMNNIRVCANCFNRHYTCQGYAANQVSYDVGNNMAILGRMSLPPPRRYSGFAAAPFTTNGMPTYGSAVSGEIVFDETPTRYYKMAWGCETTANISTFGGDPAYATTDARNPANQSPSGNYGNLSPEVACTLSSGDTLVELSLIVWTPQSDYPVTHAYFWASDQSEEDGGVFRYVGKVAYNGTDFTSVVFYDTLSNSELNGRRAHPNDFLPVPTFTAIATVGTTGAQRIVGVGNGGNTRFNTNIYGVYVKVTQGSKVAYLCDASGNNLTTKAWPRFIENGGGSLFVGNVGKGYEIDWIDKTNRYQIELVTPYQGATTTGGTGDSFEIRGCNNLYICPMNPQIQEQVRPAFILNGQQNFNAPITAVAASPNGDGCFVFTQSSSYYITGMGGPETTDSVLTRPLTFNKYPVDMQRGVVGPGCVCVGPNSSLYGLMDSAVVVFNTTGAENLSDPKILDWIRNLSYTDKSLATMSYDYTRSLLNITFPYIPDENRPNGSIAPYITGMSGGDLREIDLVMDSGTTEFTVWNGQRGRYMLTVGGVGEGSGGEGSGAQMLIQTIFADVLLLDEKRLTDMEYDPGGSQYIQNFVVAAVSSGFLDLTVPTGYGLSPYVRGVWAVCATGTNRGSFAWINRRNGLNTLSIGSWSNGAPAVGDTIVIGGIVFEYQTGAIQPSGRAPVAITGFNVDISMTSTSNYSRLGFGIFSGRVSGNLPTVYVPTLKGSFTQSLVMGTDNVLSIGVAQASRLIVGGVDWVQPFYLAANAVEQRHRMDRFAIHTNDEFGED